MIQKIHVPRVRKGSSRKFREVRTTQCAAWPSSCPSSLLLVANRMHTRKTPIITGTTKNGELISMMTSLIAPEYQIGGWPLTYKNQPTESDSDYCPLLASFGPPSG